MVQLKADSPDPFNLSYYKSRTSELHISDLLQPYVGGTQAPTGLSKKTLNTILIKESQAGCKFDRQLDVQHAVGKAEAKKVSEVYLLNEQAIAVAHEGQIKKKKDELFQFAK